MLLRSLETLKGATSLFINLPPKPINNSASCIEIVSILTYLQVVIIACMVSQITVTQLYHVLSCSKRLCLSEAVSSLRVFRSKFCMHFL
jgi:hypothetical protein